MNTPTNKNLGIPANLTTSTMLLDYLIDSGHEWLMDNNMSLDDFLFQLLNYVKAATVSIKEKVNYTNSNKALKIYDNVSDFNSNVEPDVGEVMAAGFDQSFVDEKWETIEASGELDNWLMEISCYLPFLYSVAEPNCGLSEKRRKIRYVVSMVVSALYNNGCDFGINGGKKHDTQLDDKVPPINAGVFTTLYTRIQKKLRYRRSNRKRDSAKKLVSEDDFNSEAKDRLVENDEAGNLTNTSAVTATFTSPPNVDSRRKIPFSGKTPNSSNSNKNSSNSASLSQSEMRKRKREEDKEEAEGQRAIDEERERENAELQAKRANSRIIRIPKGPLLRVDKETAYELSGKHGQDLVELAKAKKPKALPSNVPNKKATSPKSKKNNK